MAENLFQLATVFATDIRYLVLFTIYGFSRIDVIDDDDVLGVVEPDSVPREVREWLTMTFTRTSANARRRRGEERVKFRSVANAIRAGIMVDK